MELYDVVTKLTGKINPVGESHIDGERFENLKSTCELIDRLLLDVDRVSSMTNRYEVSIYMSSTFASNFLKHRLCIEK